MVAPGRSRPGQNPAYRPARLHHAAELRRGPQVAFSRDRGCAGNFVPLVWILGSCVTALRADRAAADRCNRLPLAPGTDSIQIPKVDRTALTGAQGYDKSANLPPG